MTSPCLPGPWVQMSRLAVGTCGCSGLSSGWAPRLVSQALLNGHLDQLILAQAAVQAVLLIPNGALSTRSAHLRGHPPAPLALASGGDPQQGGGGGSESESPVRTPKPSWSPTVLKDSYVYLLRRLCYLPSTAQFLPIHFVIGSPKHSLVYPCPHSSIRQSPHLPTTHPTIHPSVHLFIPPCIQLSTHPVIYLSTLPSVHLSIHLSNHLIIHLHNHSCSYPLTYLSKHPASTHPSVTYPLIVPSVHPPIYFPCILPSIPLYI